MRIDQLTFTRFIAAMAIVIFHYGAGSFLFNNEYVSFIFQQANIGVSYFFVLSGFVMIIAYHKNDKISFFDFIRNRLVRIYPAYLLALLMVVAVKIFSSVDSFEFLLNVLMLQSWFPGKALTLNYPGWSLSIELLFYVTFPFLFNKYYKKASLLNVAAAVFIFWLISQLCYHLLVQTKQFHIPFFNVKDIYYHPLAHVNEFIAGNLTGLYFISKKELATRDRSLYVLAIVISLLLVLKFSTGINIHGGMLAFLFAALVYFIASCSSGLSNFFSGNFFIFLGEISFGIYIFQYPVWLYFSDARLYKYAGLNAAEDFTLAFVLRLAILVAVSALSFKYLEGPARKYMKQKRSAKLLTEM